MTDDGAHRTCTWEDEADCVGCQIGANLNCRYDRRLARFFLWNQVPSLVLALFGTALTGYITGAWWPLIVFAVGCVVLWGLGIETRVLCSHCPFYAREGRTLRCYALDGWPKLWKYRPGPMSGVEKLIIVAFFAFLVAFPVAGETYGVWFIRANGLGGFAFWAMIGVAIATALAGLQFVYIMTRVYCASCVNFSCPLNTVPKAVVDDYLRKNPVMRAAWERSGYRLG